MRDKISVMLATEGTYPYNQGGVSTWCDLLVKRLPSIDYVIFSILMDPFVTQKFKLPQNTQLIKVPLWGTEEPSEHLTTPFSQVYLAKKRTKENIVREHFIPLFEQLLKEIVAEHKNPHQFSLTLVRMYEYFQTYEYKNTFKSEIVWETYKKFILTYTAEPKHLMVQPDVFGMVQSIGWLYRFFNILNTPIPDVNVVHSSAAALCGIPCVLSKLINKTPYLLTEHGVYLREQYLSLSKQHYSSFLNKFLIRFVQSISSMNYALADQVSPVCVYNTRWEKRLGVSEDRIKVIYNGIDNRQFIELPPVLNMQPTVVAVARIDPIKDILTLIRSAHFVRQRIPNVKFILYGSVTVPSYYEECLELHKQLNMGETFIFAGHTDNIPAAYQSGDIVALSSISEAFPYSIIEAMMSAKPIVSTDVGGIREAVGDYGILVNPRDELALAEGIIRLIHQPELRKAMGRGGRERALNLFTLDKVLESHLKSYILLQLKQHEQEFAHTDPLPIITEDSPATVFHIHIHRGYTHVANHNWQEAISEFRSAIKANPSATSTPVLLAEISEAYNRLGKYDHALMEMEKIRIWTQLHDQSQSA